MKQIQKIEFTNKRKAVKRFNEINRTPIQKAVLDSRGYGSHVVIVYALDKDETRLKLDKMRKKGL